METMESARVFEQRVGLVKQFSGRERWLPPWLFKHQDLTRALGNAQKVSQESLINTLNHIHFISGHVLVLLKHPRFEEGMLLRAYPEPCFGPTLCCAWEGGVRTDLSLGNYHFLNLVIDDGRCMILVPGVVEEINDQEIRIQLPETSYGVGRRAARRYACKGVEVELIQSGFLARGTLLEFSPLGFRMQVKSEAFCSFRWFNSAETFTIHLRQGGKMVFAGICRCVRSTGGDMETGAGRMPGSRHGPSLQEKADAKRPDAAGPTSCALFRASVPGKNRSTRGGRHILVGVFRIRRG